MVCTAATGWRVAVATVGALLGGLGPPARAVTPTAAAPMSGDAAAPVAVDAAVLERYTGTYRLGAAGVGYVTRSGDRLSLRLTGQPAFELVPTSQTHFLLKVPNTQAELDFKVDGTAPATAIELQQAGPAGTVHVVLPRIDASSAAQIEANLAARMQNNVPSPGTEAALRRLIERREAGLPPDYSAMTAPLADAVRQQLPTVQQLYGALGRMQSIQFQAVGAQGGDAFLVKFEHGSVIYHIVLDAQGLIAGLALQPL